MKALFAAAALVLMACGGGSGGGSTGGQTCDQRFSCTGGACKCTLGPNDGSSCCDPDDSTCTSNKCDSYCRFCQ